MTRRKRSPDNSYASTATMPRLRWAKKEAQSSTADHVAVDSDTFESSVLVDASAEPFALRRRETVEK